MEIIHLSDLHFGTEENARLWSSQLVQDVRREMNLSTIDALILSGDIANKATEAEYKAAQLFLNELKKEFNLQPNQIIIVPGNHDIDRNPVKKAYKNNYQGELKEGFGQGYFDQGYFVKKINEFGKYSLTDKHRKCTWEFSNNKQSDKDSDKDKDSFFLVRHEETYKQRFKNFSDFYQYIKGEPYPLEDKEQGILNYFPDQKLLIVGFNSAWKINHIDPDHLTDANINNEAISKVLNEIDQRYQDWVKIAVWHHPLHSKYEDRIKDDGFMERLSQSGFCFVIHGHIHKADGSAYHRPYEDKIRFIPAGTFGAPPKEWVDGYPLQYNRLKLTRDKLTIYTRRREELNGVWKPDARWNNQGGQPSDHYEYELPQHLWFERSSISKPFVPPQHLGVYVERPPLEKKCYQAIEKPGMIISIKAPKKMGKTMLVEKIFYYAHQQQYLTALLDFHLATKETILNYSRFSQWFCDTVSYELKIENISASNYWQSPETRGDDNTKIYSYFDQNILSKIPNKKIVLALDSMDKVFAVDFASNFLSMLRFWSGKFDNNWEKLKLILIHSQECQVKLPITESPFEVAEKFELKEFDNKQISDLALQRGFPLDDQQIAKIFSAVGGHPYLTDQVITKLKASIEQPNSFNQVVSEEYFQQIFNNDPIYHQYLNKKLSK